MNQKVQLLRKTLQAAAAARDGLHSVGAGLQQEFGWQDFSLCPGQAGHSPFDPANRGFFFHSSGTGQQWSHIHSSHLHAGIGPLALSTQVLPVLHQQQHQQGLRAAPPPPPASLQHALPLPLAPKPVRTNRRAPFPAPLLAAAPPAAPTTWAVPCPAGAPAGAPGAEVAPSPAAAGTWPAAHGAAGSHGTAKETCGGFEGLSMQEGAGMEGMLGGLEPLRLAAEGAGDAAQPQGGVLHLEAQQQQQQQLHPSLLYGSTPAAAAARVAPEPPNARAAGKQGGSAAGPVAPARGAHHGPAGKRARGSGVSVALNKSIMSASCVGELLALVRARGHSFDFFNISSAVSRAPKLVEAEQASAKASAAAAHPDGQHWYGEGGPEDAALHASQCQSGVVPAAMDEGARALVDHLYALSLQQLHTFDARGLANTAWAFAKMRYVPDASLPAALSAEASTRINEFAAQNLSNLAWAMVYMHFRDPHLLGLMADRVVVLLDQFKPQELANIMWAFASLEHHDHATLAALCSRVAQLGPRAFKEQELSNIIWALGRAHHHDGAVLDMLLLEAQSKLNSFQPQGVSNMVWALGQLNHASPWLLSAIGQRYSQAGALRAFDGQGLCNLAYGMAALHFHHPALMAALANEALRRAPAPAHRAAPLQKGSPRAEAALPAPAHGSSPLFLTTVLWAAAVLEDHSVAARLMQAVALEVGTAGGEAAVPGMPMGHWEPTALAQAAWACVRLQQLDGAAVGQQQALQQVLACLADAVAARTDRFNGQPLALAVSAFFTASAEGSVHGSKLVEQLARRVERAAPALSAQQCKVCADALQRVPSPSAAAALEALQKRAAALADAATAVATAAASACPPAVAPRSQQGSAAGHGARVLGSAGAVHGTPWQGSHAGAAAMPRRGKGSATVWTGVGAGAGAGTGTGTGSWGAEELAEEGQGSSGGAWAQVGALGLGPRGAVAGQHAPAQAVAAAAAAAAREGCGGEQGGGWGAKSTKVVATEEPWASAWSVGLFEEAAPSLVPTVDHPLPAPASPTLATQGSMWSAGGLGNGSLGALDSGVGPDGLPGAAAHSPTSIPDADARAAGHGGVLGGIGSGGLGWGIKSYSRGLWQGLAGGAGGWGSSINEDDCTSIPPSCGTGPNVGADAGESVQRSGSGSWFAWSSGGMVDAGKKGLSGDGLAGQLASGGLQDRGLKNGKGGCAASGSAGAEGWPSEDRQQQHASSGGHVMEVGGHVVEAGGSDEVSSRGWLPKGLIDSVDAAAGDGGQWGMSGKTGWALATPA